MQTQYIEQIAETAEREIARLKVARPRLEARINRAEHIITTHLAAPRMNTIKVRVSGDGRRFLVKGSEGAVYVVNPATWDCSCPDAHRRGKGCKHAISCWVLDRAVAACRPARKRIIRHAKNSNETLRGIPFDPARVAAVADRILGA